MVRAVVITVILLVVAGVVFFFGWIQINVPEDSYAVIFTKTGGWDKKVTYPGKFLWRWQRLIPTNLKIHVYPIAPHSEVLHSEGELPSGATYAKILDPAPDFSFSVDFYVSYRIKPEALPSLAANQQLLPDNLDAWYKNVSADMQSKASTIIKSLSSNSSYFDSLATDAPGLSTTLSQRLANAFPDLQILSIGIRNVKLPDMELYDAAKSQYLAIAQKRQQNQEAALAQAARVESLTERYFTILGRYGELITKYPSLLQLLALNNGQLETFLQGLSTGAFVSSPSSPQP